MWLMEQPLTIMALGTVLTMMLLGGFWQTGRGQLFYGALTVGLLTMTLFLAERLVVTPREDVKATLQLIARDLERNDRDAVLNHISAGREALRRDANAKLSLVEIHEVNIKRNLRIELTFQRGMELAEARFNASFRLRPRHGLAETARLYPQFLVVRLRKEDGHWRIRDYELSDPRAGIGDRLGGH